MAVVQLHPEPGVVLKLHKRRCQTKHEVVGVFYQTALALGVDPEDARALLEERHWR